MELAHRLADVALARADFGCEFDISDLAEVLEVEMLWQDHHELERDCAVRLQCSPVHGFGEHDHELSPVAAAGLAGLHHAETAAVFGCEAGNRFMPRLSHYAPTSSQCSMGHIRGC